MSTLKAILIDLDNTLYNWDPCDLKGREAAHIAMQQAFDISFDRFTELHKAARHHFKHLLHNQASSHNRLLYFKWMIEAIDAKPRAALALQMFQRYWQAFFHAIKPHPDAHRVLSQLKQSHRVAMVSNHPLREQLEKVIRLGFEPYFDVVIASEETGVEKPDGRIFQLALERIKAKAGDAVMIGDHTVGDIEGAHAAGLRTIYMAEFNEGEPAPKCADHVAARLGDVLGIVRGM